jgi:flagella basal body P-ring formation protein FlgA
MWKTIISSMLIMTFCGIAFAEDSADPTAQIVKQATAWIAKDQGINPGEINVRPPDRRASFDTCKSGLAFGWPFQSNTRTLEISCADPTWRYFLQVRFEPGFPAITVVKDVLKSHVLNRDDLVQITVREASDHLVSTMDALIGQTLTRDLAKGEPIQSQDIATDAMQFTTLRAYERGEVIDRMDVFFESTDRPRAGSLTEWPAGKMVANRALPENTLLVPSDLESAIDVVVTRENIIRNQVITADMVAVEARPSRQVRGTPLARPEEAIGFEATRTVRTGTILGPSDLRVADLVRKGENVTLTITRGALSISVDTVAMEDAKLGEQVLLRNSDSGREIRGVVTGRHQAKGL